MHFSPADARLYKITNYYGGTDYDGVKIATIETDDKKDDWNQPRCWSEPSRYRSAGKSKPCFSFKTAEWVADVQKCSIFLKCFNCSKHFE